MSTPKPTRHPCPICKDVVYNNVTTFHEHLNTLCATTLFSKYPGLKTEAFNSLWYKLDSMIKEQLIIPSNSIGIPAIIHQSTQPPSQYYSHHQTYPRQHSRQNYNYNTQYSHNNRNNRNNSYKTQHIGGNISGAAMDLEDLDRDIEFLQRKDKERQKNELLQQKRKRQEMEQQISNEINNDEFTLSMPKLDNATKNVSESESGTINPKKKRKLLYHNTSDIRPPKRVNIDPIINTDLFQYKVRETRRLYHNVSYNDFVSDFYGNKMNKSEKVDHHSAIIHTQRALNRYLLNCEILRKCFNGKLFTKLSEKEREIFSDNYCNHMKTILREINTWNKYEIMDQNDDKNDGFDKEDFLNSWDAIGQQTMQSHLDRLLERENLVGFYAKIDGSIMDENDSDKRHSFWNASNNVKFGGYDDSMFENAQSKKFIKL